MDPARRAHYLQSMGITVWRRRDASDDSASDVDSSAVTVVDAAGAVDKAAAVTRRQPAARAATATSPATTPEAAATRHIPDDWAGLREAVRTCTACKLCQTRNNTVFGVGPEDAPLLIVGEGPGADEDARGEPFVGRGGKLLDEMLRAIGRSRAQNTFIANVVKCRPPGNRDPEADEVEACRPFLEQQIRLIQPKLIVGLGRVAAQRLLATDLPMSKLRIGIHRYEATGTPVLLTYHPAYLLRSPREKAKAWVDLKRIHQFLVEAGVA